MPALSLGVLAEQPKLTVGYDDGSIKVYDMETQEVGFLNNNNDFIAHQVITTLCM